MLINELAIYNAKAAAKLVELSERIAALQHAGEPESSLIDKYNRWSFLKAKANDTTLPESTRETFLAVLVREAELLNKPIPQYIVAPTGVVPAPNTQIPFHNSLLGLNVGDFLHLTALEKADLLSRARLSDISFANLLGNVSDNAKLQAALDAKEDAFGQGMVGRFLGWDKTWRLISWSTINGKPTTLAGFGIEQSDTLFDGKYLQLSSPLTGFNAAPNAAVTSSTTLLGAFGRLQAQINNLVASGGTVTSVGLTLPNIFSVSNSPITSSGDIVS